MFAKTRPIAVGLAFFVALATFPALTAWAGAIPADRTVDWSIAGYGGDVPRPSKIVSALDFGAKGDGVADDRPAITAALTSLGGKPGVVLLPAGNYLIKSTLGLPSNAVLRGVGAGQTTLQCNPASSGTDCMTMSGSLLGTFRAVTGGLTKGSTVLTTADASGFVVGDWAELRETNGAWDTVPATWAKNVVGQMVRITAVNGNNLTIDTPLRIDYDPTLSPQISRVAPAHHIGIEDLTLTRLTDPTPTAGGANIAMNYVVYSWIRGYEGSTSIGSHCILYRSARVEVTGSYFHHAFTYDGTSTRGYGVTLSDHTGECLIEGNVFNHLRHAMQTKAGANGNVFAYNSSTDPFRSETFSDFPGDISLHGHYSFCNLFEGNIVANIIIDQTWGTNGPYNTFFRNRAEWYGIIITPDTNITNNQNFVANEVTEGKSNILLGLYYTLYYGIGGTGHFQLDNNVAGSIKPAGSSTVTDVSYYKPAGADFCELAPGWPAIGPASALNSGTNRARQRWTAGGIVTYDNLWVDAGADVTISDGQSIAMTGAGGGGKAVTAVAWSPTAGLSAANVWTPSAKPDISTLYTVTLTDANACSRSDSAKVTVTGVVADPQFSLVSGTYAEAQTLAMTCTSTAATIRYTLDGTEPTEASTAYTTPLQLANAVTVTAKAFQIDHTPSNPVSGSYDIDVDECATSTSSCSADAACSNTWGSYTCTCKPGLTGNGVTCTDIDECSNGSAGCDAHAICANSSGSFSCTCASGFAGDGTVCSDIDECAAPSSACDANAVCLNSVGSFSCTCNAGYTGVGTLCVDSDECATANGGCDPWATCSNIPGTFFCACPVGFVGDGMTCSSVCGDGVQVGNEPCDDGNIVDDDACANACAVNPPGDGCTAPLALTTGSTLAVVLVGAHTSTALAPGCGFDNGTAADVFLTATVKAGWSYVAQVNAATGETLGLALRYGCADATCASAVVVASAPGADATLSWLAADDGPLLLQVLHVSGSGGAANVTLTATPPATAEEADAPDAGTSDDADVTAWGTDAWLDDAAVADTAVPDLNVGADTGPDTDVQGSDLAADAVQVDDADGADLADAGAVDALSALDMVPPLDAADTGDVDALSTPDVAAPLDTADAAVAPDAAGDAEAVGAVDSAVADAGSLAVAAGDGAGEIPEAAPTAAASGCAAAPSTRGPVVILPLLLLVFAGLRRRRAQLSCVTQT